MGAVQKVISRLMLQMMELNPTFDFAKQIYCSLNFKQQQQAKYIKTMKLQLPLINPCEI